MQAAEITIKDGWIRHCHPVVEAGQETTREMLNNNPEITALFCHNDLIAVGALQACGEVGRQVPGDLAIIGYDDIRLAELVTPALTTLRIPMAEIGTQAMQMLLGQMLENDSTPQEIYVRPELIVRQSAP